MDELPTFLTDKDKILSYDYNQIDSLIGTTIDNYKFINNLSIPDSTNSLCKKYYKAIVQGYNNLFIDKIMKQHNTNSNICLPLLHQWKKKPMIDNLVIINHPADAEKICKKHIKKTPIFESFLYNSIISTTDNNDWKAQRSDMNMAFIPSLSLKKVFPISIET